tara:strand:- start:3376 stop:4317 length:942 start_codon:yes stop_codon:yes gene_type:complete
VAGNTNFDQILSTTLYNYVPKLADNVFGARPLFYALTNGQTIRRVSGGAKIIVPIIYGSNSTAASYAGADTIPITAQDGISAAEYDWKQYAATVTITGIEEGKNNGEAAIIDLLEGKIMQAEQTIIDNMNTMFWGDGTGNGGDDWMGLQGIVADGSTLGGIDPTAAGNTWWKPTMTNQGAAALTTAAMSSVYNTVSVGNDQPTIIFTDQERYEDYEALLQSNLRYTSAAVADAGFQNLLFKGAPVTFDDACEAKAMYFLNTKYIRLVAHTDTWFQPTPFVRPTNQDARFAQILCYGNLTCSNRSRQGRLFNIA